MGFGKFQGKNDEYWLGNDHIYDLLARGASIFPPQISFQFAWDIVHLTGRRFVFRRELIKD